MKFIFQKPTHRKQVAQPEESVKPKVKNIPAIIHKAPREPAPLPTLPDPEINTESTTQAGVKKDRGRRLELISDGLDLETSLIEIRPDLGASPTVELKVNKNRTYI